MVLACQKPGAGRGTDHVSPPSVEREKAAYSPEVRRAMSSVPSESSAMDGSHPLLNQCGRLSHANWRGTSGVCGTATLVHVTPSSSE